MALMKAASGQGGSIGNFIHPTKGAELVYDANTIDPSVKPERLKVKPEEAGQLTGDFKIPGLEGLRFPRFHFDCSKAFVGGRAACQWWTGGAVWRTEWELLAGKPYFTYYRLGEH